MNTALYKIQLTPLRLFLKSTNIRIKSIPSKSDTTETIAVFPFVVGNLSAMSKYSTNGTNLGKMRTGCELVALRRVQWRHISQ